MPTLFLVRHGKAAAGFDSHVDPGLDTLGQTQAREVARLLDRHGPIAIYSSPLARARETALPLIEQWGTEIVIEPSFAERFFIKNHLFDLFPWTRFKRLRKKLKKAAFWGVTRMLRAVFGGTLSRIHYPA